MQVVLLAIRALITCIDITPRAASSLVEGGALRPMCRRLLEIEDMDVAEACLKCIHLLSKVRYPVYSPTRDTIEVALLVCNGS